MKPIPNDSMLSMESRVAAAADEYLDAVRAGTAPDLETFLERHGEIAGILRQVLPTLEAIGAMSPDELVEKDDLAASRVPVGDFQIRREIGRGGMGVVYEAEQMSLGRRVALKVLPFAAVLDPRQLDRFKNEAQAAARLHHPNIVPVHSVGCDRGVHYYAMQYVEGLTVRQIIDELRTRLGRDEESASGTIDADSSSAVDALTGGDTSESRSYCRAVARLGAQAARALDHAHELGIVHRDVKPGNLIVDLGGNLWVTDFGLATFRDGEARSLTMPGDIIGTLRYMSPEQAMAKRVPIDHRTDTYSLGVTLFEFLTLEPAISSSGSQQILHDIAFKEPRPARELNRAIPEDLETILMKAMAKSPADRYATALEMAEDIERWLAGKPIEAKRPSLAKRAAKWCSRHRAVVGVAAASGVLAVVGLAVSTVMVQAAYTRELAQRQRAEANFDRARRAVNAMLDETVSQDLAAVSGAAEIRQRLLEEAQGFYEELLHAAAETPGLRLDAAEAAGQLGDIRTKLHDHSGAARAYDEGLRLARASMAETPATPEPMIVAGALARSLAQIRSMHSDPGAPEGTHESLEGLWAESVATFERLVREFPDHPVHVEELAHTYCDLGADRIRRCRLSDAEQPLRTAEELYERILSQQPLEPRRVDWLADCKQDLAHVLQAQGRFADAESEYRDVTLMLTGLSHRHPRHLGVRLALTRAYANLADLTAPPPRLPVNRHVIHSQRRWFKHLGGVAPAAWDGEAPLARIPDCGELWKLDRGARAATASRAARDLARPLVELYSDDMDYQGVFVKASVMLASVQRANGDPAAAIETLRESVAIGKDHPHGYAFLALQLCEVDEPRLRDTVEALRISERGVQLRVQRWYTWFVLGLTKFRERDFPGAADALRQALARANHRSESLIEVYLAMALWQKGDADGATLCFTRAIDRMEQHGQPHPEILMSGRAEAAGLLGRADVPPAVEVVGPR